MITDTKIAAVKQGPENLSGSLVCGGRLGGVYDRIRLRAHGSIFRHAFTSVIDAQRSTFCLTFPMDFPLFQCVLAPQSSVIVDVMVQT